MSKSKIEWTDKTWNPVTGCTKVSTGCKNCYAERTWQRLSNNPNTVYFGRGFTDVQCHPDRLEQPLLWKRPVSRPRKVFVNSMSDLFHPSVPVLFIAEVFATIAAARHHTFQVLTKRPERFLELTSAERILNFKTAVEEALTRYTYEPLIWPIPNLWLGVSVEDQDTADERIPLLLQTPAAVRWVSAEPLLGPVDLSGEYLAERCGGSYPFKGLEAQHRTKLIDLLDWMVVGGESGPKARPMHLDWARSLRDQCAAAGVPFLFKQWGEWAPFGFKHSFELPKGKDQCEWWDTPGKWFMGQANGAHFAMVKIGKRDAGRLLDGIQHDGYPS